MNDKIERLAVISGVLNYVDNETPRVYFVSGNADCEDAEYFAKLIIKECVQVCEDGKGWVPNLHWIPESAGKYWDQACEHRANAIKKHFGVK